MAKLAEIESLCGDYARELAELQALTELVFDVGMGVLVIALWLLHARLGKAVKKIETQMTEDSGEDHHETSNRG